MEKIIFLILAGLFVAYLAPVVPKLWKELCYACGIVLVFIGFGSHSLNGVIVLLLIPLLYGMVCQAPQE